MKEKTLRLPVCDCESSLELPSDPDLGGKKFRWINLAQTAMLMFNWSGLGILPCCRKIFLCRLSFGFLVIMGFKNLI